MKLREKNIAENLFQRFCDEYKNRNVEALLNLCAKNINMWGSAEDEYRVGLKEVENQFKRDFSQAEKNEIEVLSFVPTPKDSLWTAAICTAKITIEGQEHIFSDFRGTIVMTKEEGTFKILHMHASFPDYRNAPNGSFPIDS